MVSTALHRQVVHRVAVVGLGSAGTTLHLPALTGIPHAEIVAVVDPDHTRQTEVSRRYTVPGFATMEDMLTTTQPTVVIVATPPHCHTDDCLRALQAGAHVICEKPFVHSLYDADRVIQAAQLANRQVAVNHEFREMPIFRALREQVSPADIRFAQAWQCIDLSPSGETGWRSAIHQRTLFEAGVHLLDMLIALYGECPAAVTATTSNAGADDNANDAILVLTLEFSRGRIAQLVQNRLSKGERQYLEVRLDTAEASWRASFGGRARISAGLHRSTKPHVRTEFGISGTAWKETGARRTQVARNPRDPGMLATRFVVSASLHAFDSGTRPPTDAQLAQDILAVTAACYESAATRTRIAIDHHTKARLFNVQLGVSSFAVPSTEP